MIITLLFDLCSRGNVEELPGGYDGFWPTRGNGRTYNSRVGGGTVTSADTGRIYAYGFRHRDCRTCAYWEREGKKPPPHTCLKDWKGSSKAMEASIAEELCVKIQNSGTKINPIIMDNDTTTPARLRNVLNYELTKWDDTGHSSKGLQSKLYELSKVHKELRLEGHTAIKTIKAHYNYAVAQCKGKPDDLADRLGQIVPHIFDEHDKCGSWCKAAEDPLYKPKGLPKDKYLEDKALRLSLDSLFKEQINNVDSIAPAASTRPNESNHNIFASKAAKVRWYGGSESYDGRVSCGVCSKNIGYDYCDHINKSMNISPCVIAKQVADRKTRKRKKQQIVENSREFKIRRKMRKIEEKQAQKSCKVKEGVTYESNVSAPGAEDQNVESIPEPIVTVPKELDEMACVKVVYDLETTGLKTSDQILQIAAISGINKFSTYVTPTKRIPKSASDVTKLECVGGTLMKRTDEKTLVPLSSVSLPEALSELISFLQSINQGDGCILIAHNAPFDQRFTMKALADCDMSTDFSELVVGFADTLPIYRKLYPKLNAKSGGSGHSQEALVKHIIGKKYDAHNAVADVQALQDLINHTKLTDKQLLAESTSTKYYMQQNGELQDIENANLPSLQSLVKSKVLSLQMAKKMARSGLAYAHLKLAFTRETDGFEGIRALLSEVTSSGKVRVTNKVNIIRRVVDYFQGLEKS